MLEISLKEEINTINDLGAVEGSDKSMENLIYEIWKLEQKLLLMSVIKASAGIKELIEDKGFDEGIIKLDTVEHFGYKLVYCEFLHDKFNNKEIKSIENLINGWLSNIRFDNQPYLIEDLMAKIKGAEVVLNNKTIEDKLLNLFIEPELISIYYKEKLEDSLKTNLIEKNTQKI